MHHLTQKAHFCIYTDILTDMQNNTHTLFIRALFIKAKTLETTYKGQLIRKPLELVIEEQVCFFLKETFYLLIWEVATICYLKKTGSCISICHFLKNQKGK